MIATSFCTSGILFAIQSFLLLTLLSVDNYSLACTEFMYMNNKGETAVGRDLEFAVPLNSQLITIPRNRTQSSLTSTADNIWEPSSYQWNVDYGYASVNAFGINITADGMNEAGLTCSILLLPGFAHFQTLNYTSSTTYTDLDEKGHPHHQNLSGNVIMQMNFCDWALSQYSSVKEVNATLKAGDLTVLGMTPQDFARSSWAANYPPVVVENIANAPSSTFEVHFSLHDKEGNSIVIEYTEGDNAGPNIYNNALGVMTNSPPYPWHVMNMNYYIGLSGINPNAVTLGVNTPNPNYNSKQTFSPFGFQGNFPGLSADFSSQSRFTRVALFLQNVAQTAAGQDTVNVVTHILNSVDVFEGGAAERNFNTNSKNNNNSNSNINNDNENNSNNLGYDRSQWATIRDFEQQKFYFRSYLSPQWKVIDLNEPGLFEPNAPSYTVSMDIPLPAYKANSDMSIFNETN